MKLHACIPFEWIQNTERKWKKKRRQQTNHLRSKLFKLSNGRDSVLFEYRTQKENKPFTIKTLFKLSNGRGREEERKVFLFWSALLTARYASSFFIYVNGSRVQWCRSRQPPSVLRLIPASWHNPTSIHPCVHPSIHPSIVHSRFSFLLLRVPKY